MVKNPPVNAEDMGLTSRSERSSGEGKGNLRQYSCLGNPMDRAAWLGGEFRREGIHVYPCIAKGLSLFAVLKLSQYC